MNVLFLASDLSYPPHGGRSQRTFNTLREAARRHSVHFLAFDQGLHGRGANRRAEALHVLREFCASADAFPLSVKHHRAAIPLAIVRSLATGEPYSTAIYRSRTMEAAIRRICSTHAVDLLHCDSTDLGFFRAIADVPAALVVHHNVESELMRRRVDRERFSPRRSFVALESRKLRRYEQGLGPLYDVHLTVSDIDRELLGAHVPADRIQVVANGVDVTYFRPAPETPQVPATVVHVGGLNWFPNLDGVRYFLDDAWQQVRAARPESRFRLVGANPPEDLVRNGPAQGVDVLGFVPDMRPVVDESAVYVVPLRLGGGTRLKILDAMSMGKAIVSTSIGCEGLDVRDGHDIVIADSPAGIARAILQLFEDEHLRRRIGNAARETVMRRYSWQYLGEKQEAAYQAALAPAAVETGVGLSEAASC